MEQFTPVASLLGGAMIGASASLLLIASGQIAGISGIVGGLLDGRAGDLAWRAWFIVGLLAGGVMVAAVAPEALGMSLIRSPGALVGGGLLVGFGTSLGGGCTSGHGVCGISRFAPRSILATATFMLFAGITVYLVNHLFGGVL